MYALNKTGVFNLVNSASARLQNDRYLITLCTPSEKQLQNFVIHLEIECSGGILVLMIFVSI